MNNCIDVVVKDVLSFFLKVNSFAKFKFLSQDGDEQTVSTDPPAESDTDGKTKPLLAPSPPPPPPSPPLKESLKEFPNFLIEVKQYFAV